MTPFNKFKTEFQGKRVLIMGLGILGRGADVAKTFAQIGCSVIVTDLKKKPQLSPSLKKLKNLQIRFRLGEHRREDVLSSDIIIRNPGVSWRHPLLKLARDRNKPVLMDTSLFAKYFPGTMIGVTGTRGKTTTTLIIYALLRAANKPAFLAGNASQKANIGLLQRASQDSLAVLELSSWELQGFRAQKISPQIAVLTNIYEDHLNRYKNMREYLEDKAAIFACQKASDYLVANRDNELTSEMAKRARSNLIWFSKKDFPSTWSLPLPGEHNRENAAAAYKVGEILDIETDLMRRVFASFKGVAHRLETISSVTGVRFVNDTTSTTPIATIIALKAISPPPILLVGGNSKNLKIDELAKTIKKRAKAVVLLRGDGTQNLKRKLKKLKFSPIIAENLAFEKAVKKAVSFARPGDVVLLSPGFTSFAEFANEFERGERFKSIVIEKRGRKRK